MLLDKRGWAFHRSARSLAGRLSHKYEFVFWFAEDGLGYRDLSFDVFFCFIFNRWPREHISSRTPLIKLVAGEGWRYSPSYGVLDDKEMVRKYLSDCDFVVTPSPRVHAFLSSCREHVHYLPNGIEPGEFHRTQDREGPLVFGFVGRPDATVKGVQDILLPACEGRCRIRIAGGNLDGRQLLDFYNELDVLLIGSYAEGEPLPLMEALACGCFPVTTDVGIVRELIRDGENGLIVPRTVEDFARAIDWCLANPETVRAAARKNAASERVTQRVLWGNLIPKWEAFFDLVLASRQDGVAPIGHTVTAPALSRDASPIDAIWSGPPSLSPFPHWEVWLRPFVPQRRNNRFLLLGCPSSLAAALREEGYSYVDDCPPAAGKAALLYDCILAFRPEPWQEGEDLLCGLFELLHDGGKLLLYTNTRGPDRARGGAELRRRLLGIGFDWVSVTRLYPPGLRLGGKRMAPLMQRITRHGRYLLARLRGADMQLHTAIRATCRQHPVSRLPSLDESSCSLQSSP